ncbi:MAG: hypothetical protein ACE5GW_07770 [Planctomycetota bacterium]
MPCKLRDCEGRGNAVAIIGSGVSPARVRMKRIRLGAGVGRRRRVKGSAAPYTQLELFAGGALPAHEAIAPLRPPVPEDPFFAEEPLGDPGLLDGSPLRRALLLLFITLMLGIAWFGV